MFLSRISLHFILLGILSTVSGVLSQNADSTTAPKRTTVLILGGGMTGVIATRTLHEQGINDIVILEAQGELGGRMSHTTFGIPGRQVVVERGAGWMERTSTGDKRANPIWDLARKHGLATVYYDEGNITTYDESGYNNYTDVFINAAGRLERATILAGQHIKQGKVDMSLRSAYRLMGISAKTPQEAVGDYFLIDFVGMRVMIYFIADFSDWFSSDVAAQSLSQTSWHAFGWNTGVKDVPHGIPNNVQMCTDQRGFSHIVQAEAAELLQSEQVIYNETVNLIEYGEDNVTVHTASGLTIIADHVLCTFSVGVLQHDDVRFQPPLPDWKVEAINIPTMATLTKIFLQFNETFWFPTISALYADRHRGKYPVWGSLDHAGLFPGSGIIYVVVSGDWSLYVEQLTLDEVKSEVMEVLQTMYPNITIPEPVDIHVPRWTSDKLFRGSYASWGPPYDPYYLEVLKATVGKRLWFAGEATSVKDFGSLYGAYFEGQSVGAALAACIQGTGDCERPHVEFPKNANQHPF